MPYEPNNDQHHRSSSRLEDEVRHTRAQMDETLDELGDRLDPGRLASDAWRSVRGSMPDGGEASDAMMRAGRDISRRIAAHPVPSALVGLGLVWLLSEEATGHRASSDAIAQRGGAAASATGERGRRMIGKAGDAAKGIGQRVGDKASELGSSAAHTASDAASSAYDYAQTATQRTAEQARRAASRTAEATSDAYDSSPLLFGAMAAAAGLIAGIAAPKTRAEREAFGETGETLRSRAAEAGKNAGERLADSVAEGAAKMAEDAQDAAEEAADKVESAPSRD
jgi:hypothetical protein